jgi:hypothetical protein
MKHIKFFEEKAIYESYINNSPTLPNVSFAEDTNQVFYNPFIDTTIDTTGFANGVYAVSADYKLIDYKTADASCIGVAFISDNQKVMIPKEDATNGTNNTLYWGKNLFQQDVPNLENLEYEDVTADKADYNGKANTAAIIAGYATLGQDMDSRDMCKVLETYNEGGYIDWYVPVAGQLYEFYSNKTDINAALAKIGGTAFESKYYWSSSELDSDHAWTVSFSFGGVSGGSKDDDCRVRFIRDI